MIAATSTMWDVLSWGGETQALIYDPRAKKVVAINGLGVAPTGATPEFYRSKGFKYPPAYGPLAAVTPGTPGGLMLMLEEYGTLTLGEVLQPAIELADGYPIDAETADNIEKWKAKLKEWPYSKQVMLTHPGAAREAPRCGRDLPAAGPGCDVTQTGRDRKRRAQGRQVARRSYPRRVRALLPRRHRTGIRTGRAGTRRADHPGRLAKLAAHDRAAAHDELPWRRGL